MSKKLNLVLINGFGSNGEIIKGVLDTLSEFYNVYFLELPGSVKHITLKKYTTKNFIDYFQKEINKLKLKEYILGSLSFGFPLSNELKIDKKCKGILAIEPYLDKKYTHMSLIKRSLFILLIKSICFFKIYHLIWETNLFKKALFKLGYNETIIKCIWKLDPKPYFETGKLVLTYTHKPNFHNLPHVLMINEHDNMINAEKTIETFKHNVKNLLIIKTTVPHYPDKMGKNSILQKVHKNNLQKMITFFKKN